LSGGERFVYGASESVFPKTLAFERFEKGGTVSGAEGAVSSGLRSVATREDGAVGVRSGANQEAL
jgi:hypothetical protein